MQNPRYREQRVKEQLLMDKRLPMPNEFKEGGTYYYPWTDHTGRMLIPKETPVENLELWKQIWYGNEYLRSQNVPIKWISETKKRRRHQDWEVKCDNSFCDGKAVWNL